MGAQTPQDKGPSQTCSHHTSKQRETSNSSDSFMQPPLGNGHLTNPPCIRGAQMLLQCTEQVKQHPKGTPIVWRLHLLKGPAQADGCEGSCLSSMSPPAPFRPVLQIKRSHILSLEALRNSSVPTSVQPTMPLTRSS